MKCAVVAVGQVETGNADRGKYCTLPRVIGHRDEIQTCKIHDFVAAASGHS